MVFRKPMITINRVANRGFARTLRTPEASFHVSSPSFRNSSLNMKRLKRLHQHIYDRVDLKIALKGCADEPEKAAFLVAQIEEKTREMAMVGTR